MRNEIEFWDTDRWGRGRLVIGEYKRCWETVTKYIDIMWSGKVGDEVTVVSGGKPVLDYAQYYDRSEIIEILNDSLITRWCVGENALIHWAFSDDNDWQYDERTIVYLRNVLWLYNRGAGIKYDINSW